MNFEPDPKRTELWRRRSWRSPEVARCSQKWLERSESGEEPTDADHALNPVHHRVEVLAVPKTDRLEIGPDPRNQLQNQPDKPN